jgi:hypothetical protein
MTFTERAAAVEALGFNPRQAAFLTAVALHSGYCLRRQYAAFAGCKYGKNVCDFLDGLVTRGLADRVTFRADRGSIYHLFGRRVYTALGQEDNRNRRHASPPVIARRLMLLDFVLDHPGLDWYATESDKIDLFVNRLGVPAPATASRCWTQRLPIFLHAAASSVHFVCLVTDLRGSSIESFVREHAPLLRHLHDWTLNVVMPPYVFAEAACHAAYRRALAAASLLEASTEEVAWYVSTRQLVLAGDLRRLTVEDLTRYRGLAARLGLQATPHVAGPLIVHRLSHSYAQFGAFAGVV